MEAFAGIDVAFARGKALPMSICVRHRGRLEPLRLRDPRAFVPPRGRGNPGALNETPVCEFADEAVQYLHQVERHFGVRIARVAIDAPSDPKSLGTKRRLAESWH
jgi:hypothetical protein